LGRSKLEPGYNTHTKIRSSGVALFLRLSIMIPVVVSRTCLERKNQEEHDDDGGDVDGDYESRYWSLVHCHDFQHRSQNLFASMLRSLLAGSLCI
jgi:hypothetical protein